jgi:hypothetical protein
VTRFSAPTAWHWDFSSTQTTTAFCGGFRYRPTGHQETIFRAAGWDLSKPLPNGWQITQEQLRRAAEEGGTR